MTHPRGRSAAQIDPDVFTTPPPRHRARGLWVTAAVGLGGGIGSVLRYLLQQAIPVPAHGFPWGTFAANVTGSLVLGLLMVYILEVWPPRRYLRPFLCVGVIGGYTTFSTYVTEVRDIAAAGLWSRADAYALTSLVAGLSAVWCGVVAGRLLARTAVRRTRTTEES